MARDERQTVTAYQTSEDRDIAVEAGYTLSSVILAVFGERPKSTLAGIYVHLAEIAELYLREDRSHERPEDHFARWCVRHFGRVLEPAARGLLHQEVWRRLEYRDGGTKRPTASLYASWSEQERWEAAERGQAAYVPGESHVARMEGICRAVGVELGPGPQRMPSAFTGLSRYAEHERRQELRAQAARLPYADEPEDDTLAHAGDDAEPVGDRLPEEVL